MTASNSSPAWQEESDFWHWRADTWQIDERWEWARSWYLIWTFLAQPLISFHFDAPIQKERLRTFISFPWHNDLTKVTRVPLICSGVRTHNHFSYCYYSTSVTILIYEINGHTSFLACFSAFKEGQACVLAHSKVQLLKWSSNWIPLYFTIPTNTC